jgi:2-oxoglutarate dehydrogenase E1 component
MQVCYPSTPAQFFHVLRRQMRRNFRRPLVLMTPKSLLRHPLAKSGLEEFTGGGFREVIDDPKADANKVRRVLLCSGKVYYDFYYDAMAEKPGPRAVPDDIAIVRVEQLYPFPDEALQSLKRKYRKVREWVWAQEEPQNMGPWRSIRHRLEESAAGVPLRFVGRTWRASPSEGYPTAHSVEQDRIARAALTV